MFLTFKGLSDKIIKIFISFARLKGPGTECVTLTTKFFASAVAQDRVLSV